MGLKFGSCLIADIGVDVPHGQLVNIPADRAMQSKDLYRALSQRYITRFTGGANPLLPEVTALRARVQALEEENRSLREQIAARPIKVAPVTPHAEPLAQDKLDTILALLQQRPVQTPLSYGASPLAVVTDLAPPPFIPSKIRPEEMPSEHIQTESYSSEAGSVTGAAARLRELRRNQQ